MDGRRDAAREPERGHRQGPHRSPRGTSKTNVWGLGSVERGVVLCLVFVWMGIGMGKGWCTACVACLETPQPQQSGDALSGPLTITTYTYPSPTHTVPRLQRPADAAHVDVPAGAELRGRQARGGRRHHRGRVQGKGQGRKVPLFLWRTSDQGWGLGWGGIYAGRHLCGRVQGKEVDVG